MKLTEKEKEVDFDPLDDTKIWSEPLMPVGRMVLNRNPKNFFAEVEQAAFAPSALVPEIKPSADEMTSLRLERSTAASLRRTKAI